MGVGLYVGLSVNMIHDFFVSRYGLGVRGCCEFVDLCGNLILAFFGNGKL